MSSRKQRKCIDYSRCASLDSMVFLNERDFVRVYYDHGHETHLISVKNVLLEVSRVAQQPEAPGGGARTDIEGAVTDTDALGSLVRLENDLKELSDRFCHPGKFPAVDDRVLMHRVRAGARILTRLRIAQTPDNAAALDALRKGDVCQMTVVLMGLRHAHGEVFPVWRALGLQVRGLDEEENEGGERRDDDMTADISELCAGVEEEALAKAAAAALVEPASVAEAEAEAPVEPEASPVEPPEPNAEPPEANVEPPEANAEPPAMPTPSEAAAVKKLKKKKHSAGSAYDPVLWNELKVDLLRDIESKFVQLKNQAST